MDCLVRVILLWVQVQLFHRKFLISTASAVFVPRERANPPSRDHWKLKIFSEVKCVTGIAGPPASGCAKMFPTPAMSLMKATDRPSDDQTRGGEDASGNWKVFTGGPPATGTMAKVAVLS